MDYGGNRRFCDSGHLEGCLYEFRKNRMKFGIFLIVIGILDFGIGLGMGLLDGFIVDKKIAIPFINIFGGVLLCSIATNLFIKIKLDGREVLKDEEFETEVC